MSKTATQLDAEIKAALNGAPSRRLASARTKEKAMKSTLGALAQAIADRTADAYSFDR